MVFLALESVLPHMTEMGTARLTARRKAKLMETPTEMRMVRQKVKRTARRTVKGLGHTTAKLKVKGMVRMMAMLKARGKARMKVKRMVKGLVNIDHMKVKRMATDHPLETIHQQI
jgi:hypothetical protein